MNFSNELIKTLDELGTRFGLLVDWTSENIIPYVQNLGERIIQYEVATSIAWMFIAILFIVQLFVFIKKRAIIGQFSDDVGSDTFYAWLIYICSAVLCLIGIIVIGHQIFDIIKCFTIPEVVWINYLQGLTTK